jgi:uncharacterized protein
MSGDGTTVSLTSRWFIRPGREAEVLGAVRDLAARVQAGEPGTLLYLAHTPWAGADLQSLPPSPPQLLLFVEMYRDRQAFLDHVNGAIFVEFLRRYGECFIPDAQGRPYTTVEFLQREAGFVRAAVAAVPDAAANRHPSVMFEIIARDQAAAQAFYSRVFGWNYEAGASGFSYVHFPLQVEPLLGGIGQADASVPGFEPGHNFYLRVERLDEAIDAAVAAGGSRFVEPTPVDGYRFAMIRDPEGNPVGLIEPFAC